jgi:fluoroquinolone resistance protein
MITMDTDQLRTAVDQQRAVESAIFADLDWSDFDCEGGAFTDCRFVEAQFNGTVFNSASFGRCQFVRCRFSHADLREAAFNECQFLERADTVG